MKYKKYLNVVDEDITQLDHRVNEFISKGCKVVGNVNSIAINTNVFWIQTIIVNDDSNSVLGDFDVIPSYLIEVKQLAAAGNKLAAVKLYKESTGLGLKEAKDWVDNNC